MAEWEPLYIKVKDEAFVLIGVYTDRAEWEPDKLELTVENDVAQDCGTMYIAKLSHQQVRELRDNLTAWLEGTEQ